MFRPVRQVAAPGRRLPFATASCCYLSLFYDVTDVPFAGNDKHTLERVRTSSFFELLTSIDFNYLINLIKPRYFNLFYIRPHVDWTFPVSTAQPLPNKAKITRCHPVSYTHLTLPTILRV